MTITTSTDASTSTDTNTDATPITLSATVYVTPQCTRCPHMVRQLTRLGAEPTIVDVSENETAYRVLTEDLGARQTPVAIVSGVYRREAGTGSETSTGSESNTDLPVILHGFAVDQLLQIKRTIAEREKAGAVLAPVTAVLDEATGLPTGLRPTDISVLGSDGRLGVWVG